MWNDTQRLFDAILEFSATNSSVDIKTTTETSQSQSAPKQALYGCVTHHRPGKCWIGKLTYNFGELLFANAASLTHASEHAAQLPKLLRGAQLDDLALVHDAYPVIVDDGPYPVRNRQHRLALESLEHRALDLLVRLEVHVGGGFVAHDNPAAPHQHPGECEELPLTEGEVQTLLLDLVVEAERAQVGLSQSMYELPLGTVVEGVEIRPHSAAEQRCVLRDDGEP